MVVKCIIDRFEGDCAVVELEDGTITEMNRLLLPANAAEGSVIVIECDEAAAEKRRAEMKEKMHSIFHK